MLQHIDSRRRRALRGGGIALATAILLSVASASAQTRSPDIKAEERRDPASGEVVIINRKKSKNAAPNPYAPKQSGPSASSKSAKAAPPVKPLIRKDTGVPSPRPIAQPPLPQLNTEQRTATGRLRQFPQAGLVRPKQPSRATPERRPAIEPPPRRRRAAARQRLSERRRYRQRPWRQCRILARRCQAGYDRSCYLWERRCT